MNSHVAVYCRRSRDQSGQAVSVAVQERNARKYAEQRWPGAPVEAYVDNDLSAANPDVVRPSYQRMLDAIRAGAVVGIVGREQSRFTRQPSEWEELCITLSRAGLAEVHTTSGGIVSVAKASRLAGRLIAVVDAEEAERASIRIRIAAQALADEGRPSGSTSYGYQRAIGSDGRGILVPHPAEVPIVQRIIAELANGASTGAIASALTAEGIPTPRGAARWHRETVRVIANAPRIVGQRVHQGKIVGPAQWPAIVDRDLWGRAMAQLASTTVISSDGRTRTAARRQSPAQRYLLTGLAVCAACGTPLIAAQQARRNAPRVRAYSCPHPSRVNGGCGKVSATADLVDAEIVIRLRAAAAAGRLSSPAPAAGDRKTWATRLAAAEERLGTLAHSWGAGEISELEWRAARGAAATDADIARTELGRFDVPVELGDPYELVERWDTLPLRAQRAVLATVTERIAIAPRWGNGPHWDPDRVIVDWLK